MGRRLERHLDQDLIDRMDAGWTPTSVKPTVKKQSKPPRPASTYRAARKYNGVGIKKIPVIVIPAPPVRWNRSAKWGNYTKPKYYGFPSMEDRNG